MDASQQTELDQLLNKIQNGDGGLPMAGQPSATPAPVVPPTIPSAQTTSTPMPAVTPAPIEPGKRAQAVQSSNTPSMKPSRPMMMAAGVIVLLLAILGGVWGWRYFNSNSTNPPVEKIANPPETNLDEIESVNEAPAVGLAQVADEKDLATVTGKICNYYGEWPGGTIIFYDQTTPSIVRAPLAAREEIFQVKLPKGEYVLLFEPDENMLSDKAAKMGYTRYVECGLDPKKCTDHTLLEMKLEAGKEYGSVATCDPLYDDTSLPAALKNLPAQRSEDAVRPT